LKKAFITGITGQDGSYLAELLIQKGYEVHGLVRRTSTFNRERIEHLFREKVPIALYYGDMTDQSSLISVLQSVEPDEIYNLAAQSHVKVSFEEPEYTANSDALGVLRILEAVKSLHLVKKTRIYQASSSEMYGGIQKVAQDEMTPFVPQSPYAAAKLYAFWVSSIYRKGYGMFVCNGILFNHESPRRSESFVTRKITLGVSRIAHGHQDILVLGNLDTRRDWGFAPEYVEAMWTILQQPEPDDYVIATGETHSVREFVEESFRYIGVQIEWQGHELNEVGVDAETRVVRIKVSKDYYRPIDVEFLLGTSEKAKRVLGWQPRTKFRELVQVMMKEDMARIAAHGERFSYFV
jgi:GDPmannose 4,6-dehydratase